MGWHHSGFNVYCGEAIWPSNDKGLERLAQYIIRAPISQERMIYIPQLNPRTARLPKPLRRWIGWLKLVTHILKQGRTASPVLRLLFE
ncbi:MAG: transposase [Bacillota bacterium]